MLAGGALSLAVNNDDDLLASPSIRGGYNLSQPATAALRATYQVQRLTTAITRQLTFNTINIINISRNQRENSWLSHRWNE